MKHIKRIFFITLLLSSMGQIMVDLYLPSLPAIQSALNTDINSVQLTISLYVFGLAVSQLIYGPLSDAYGRKPLLLIGGLITLLGSVLCVYANSIEALIFGRLLQGLGAGAGISLSRSILRDIFSGKKLAQTGSLLAVGSVALMTSAPLLGGVLQESYGWHANFKFLLLFSVVLLLLIAGFLPETNHHRNKAQLQSSVMKAAIKQLLSSRVFLAYSLCIAFTYAAIFSWVTISALLLIGHLKMTPIGFGWSIVGIGGIFAISSLSNAYFVSRYSCNKLVNFGLIVMSLGAVMLLVLSNHQHWLSVIIPIYIFVAGTSFIFANAIASALEPFPKISGLASALLGFLQILAGAMISFLIASFALQSQLWLGVLLLTLSSSALLLKWLLICKVEE